MANCFLCHRKPDAVLVERLADELRNAGHQVWFDAHTLCVIYSQAHVMPMAK